MQPPVDDDEMLPVEIEELAVIKVRETLASPEVPDEEKSELDQLIARNAAAEREAAAGDGW